MGHTMFSILLLDSDLGLLTVMADDLRQKGFEVTTARELEEAEALIINGHYSLVIACIGLSSTNSDGGLRLLDDIRERSPDTKVVLLEDHNSPGLRAEALRRGAQAILDRPRHVLGCDALAQTVLEAADGQCTNPAG